MVLMTSYFIYKYFLFNWTTKKLLGFKSVIEQTDLGPGVFAPTITNVRGRTQWRRCLRLNFRQRPSVVTDHNTGIY